MSEAPDEIWIDEWDTDPSINTKEDLAIIPFKLAKRIQSECEHYHHNRKYQKAIEALDTIRRCHGDPELVCKHNKDLVIKTLKELGEIE